MYDAVLGRFFSEDPIGIDPNNPNLYPYCKNDPVNLTDPSGLLPEPELTQYLTFILDAQKKLSAGESLIINIDGAHWSITKTTDSRLIRQKLASATTVVVHGMKPPAIPPEFLPPAQKPRTPPPDCRNNPDASVEGLDITELVFMMLDLSRDFLKGEALERLNELITGPNLALFVGSLVAIGLSQGTPAAPIVDTGLLALLVGFLGIQAIDVISEIASIIKLLATAKTCKDVTAAAETFASVFTKIVATGAVAYLGCKATKSVKDIAPKVKAKLQGRNRISKGKNGTGASTTPTLEEIAPGIADDAIVNFGATARGIVSPPTGASYWFRWGDIKHLTPAQVRTIIGQMAEAGLEAGMKFIRVAKDGSKGFDKVPSQGGFSEYKNSSPVPVKESVPLNEGAK